MRYFIATLFLFAAFTASAQHKDIGATSEFKISGMVKHELTISINDLQAFRQDTLKDVAMKNSHNKEQDKPHHIKGILLKTLLDSAEITAANHKEYGELIITLTASDNYRNVYSWSELYNTEVGNNVYLITEMDGKAIAQMKGRITVISLSDLSSGRRNLKALSRIEVKKAP